MFAKIFESLVLDKFALDLKNCIVGEQHGFRSGKSTSTNLMLLHNYVTSVFSTQRQVDCILLGFSKAFDLAYLFQNWAMEYLVPCFVGYRAILDGSWPYSEPCTHSTAFPVLSDVPQCSHYLPSYINLFLNDICKVIPTKCLYVS